MKHDKTQPVPAPAGFKWVVTRSIYQGYSLELGLWDESFNPDEYGMAQSEPLKKATQHFAKGVQFPQYPAARDSFNWASEIRSTSKRILRAYLCGESEKARVTALLTIGRA